MERYVLEIWDANYMVKPSLVGTLEELSVLTHVPLPLLEAGAETKKHFTYHGFVYGLKEKI